MGALNGINNSFLIGACQKQFIFISNIVKQFTKQPNFGTAGKLAKLQ